MAASERGERGGAIAYRGAERFQSGDTDIAQRSEGRERLFILYSRYPH